jgi:hypothetical protein
MASPEVLKLSRIRDATCATLATTATEIRDATTAYSIAVAPQSSQNKLWIILMILFFMGRFL